MIGLGVVEVILAWWGLCYLFSNSRRDDNIEYIQLSEEQFDSLKGSLLQQQILPQEMALTHRIALRSQPSQTPPKYEDVSLRETRMTSELEADSSSDSDAFMNHTM